MKYQILFLLAVLLVSVTSSLGQGLQLIDEPCQNYQETSAALQEAKAAWVDPDCYDFAYTFTGFQVGLPVPQAVRVRNGVAENGEKTMDDFFGMVESLCVEGCPDAGAARCEIEYALEGYPMNIFIDIDKYQPDNRRAYTIEDFAFVVCDGQEEPTDVPETPEEQPQESAEPSPVEGPADGPTVSPTRGAPEDDTTSNSPTQVAPVDDTTSTNPTQVAPVDDTTTNSPTQTNNPIDLETRSTVVLSGFRISLSAEEEKSVDDTALSTVVTQYLREDLEKLDGFLDVRLVVMNEDMTGQTGRQAQPYESRMFFGEAFFAGDAPEDSAVLEIQGAALNDNTRMQKALSDGGVDAVLIKTEIYGKETIGTEDPATSAVGILHYSFWFSLIATAASLAAAV